MSHVPLYVYFLFVFLMYLGVKRCFPRVVKLQRLSIMPLCFIALSVHSIHELFNSNLNCIVYWILGSFMGIYLGYLHIKNKIIMADHDKKLIYVPGDWSMLLLIFSIFMFEFLLNYAIKAHWIVTKMSYFEETSISIIGLIAGMTIGRNLTYLYKYQVAPNQSLKLST